MSTLLAVLPLLLILLFFGSLICLLSTTEAGGDEEQRLRQLLAASNQTASVNINLSMTFALYGTSTFGVSLNTAESLDSRYEKLKMDAKAGLARMLELSVGNGEEETLTKKIATLFKQLFLVTDRINFLIEDKGENFTPATVAQQKRQMITLVQNIAYLEDQLKVLITASQLRNQQERLIQHRLAAYLLYSGIVSALGTCILLSVLIGRSITGRLRALRENALRLAEQEPLIPRISGEDEISELDNLFHSMAEALAASRKERAIIENALDVICSLSQDLTFTKVSPAAASLWGYQPDELVGKKLNVFLFPDDRESTVENLFPERLPAYFESRFLRKDGQPVWTLWSARWSASEATIFCVAHNLEARKQAEERIKASEERIRAIMEKMPVALIALGSDGLIAFCNQAMADLVGLVPTELLGRSFASLFPEYDGLEEIDFLELIRQRTRNDLFELDLMTQQKSPRRVQLSLRTWAGHEGEQYLAALLDVTERYKAQKMRQNLMVMVRHDISTPLSSIHAVLSLLGAGALGKMTDDGKSMVIKAEQESKRLMSLFNTLLQVERQEIEKLSVQSKPVRISELIEQSLDAVRTDAERKEISIIAAPPEELVLVDAGKIITVIVNLLSNAIKVSAEHSHIIITTATNGCWLEIEVRDQGRGIPPGLKEKIFSPYRQACADQDSIGARVGVGLARCKSIIEAHGGSIRVRNNRNGRGSCFSFTLPLAQECLNESLSDSINSGSASSHKMQSV